MTESTQFQPVVTTNLTTTIANGESESLPIDLSGTTFVGIQIPAGFEGAALTLKAATAKDASFYAVHDHTGVTLGMSVGASQIIALQPAQFAGLRVIKLVADTPQTGDITLTLLTRPL